MNPRKSLQSVKNSIYLILIFCLSIQFQTELGATPNEGGNIKFGVAFLMGFPQSEFADNVENNGYGLNVNFDYTFPQSPFAIGLSGGFLIYGQETRREPFSLTIPDVTVEVTRSNNIVPINLYFRVVPIAGAVLPYVEGLFGLNYLFTETSIKDVDAFDEDIASSKNLEDVSFSYGVGGGFMFRVYQKNKNQGRTRSDDDDNKVSSVYINLGLSYRKGGEAEYLTKGSITIDDGIVTYDARESKTDIMMLKIGVVIAF